jgi:hypothetical protein
MCLFEQRIFCQLRQPYLPKEKLNEIQDNLLQKECIAKNYKNMLDKGTPARCWRSLA